jgi:hypothetical protein
MFFPNLIKSIKSSDRVLEIGPGGNPHPRSDVLLEYDFESTELAQAQRGYTPSIITEKPIILYKGDRFPFEDKEFDYVICSHVLEHVQNVDIFISEITRVAHAGYLEYPTIYYDYIYNFPEHMTFIKYKKQKIFWMNKSKTALSSFQEVHNFFYHSLCKNYTSLIDELKPYFFEGFEWCDAIKSQETNSIADLSFDLVDIKLTLKHLQDKKTTNILKKIKHYLKFQ